MIKPLLILLIKTNLIYGRNVLTISQEQRTGYVATYTLPDGYYYYNNDSPYHYVNSSSKINCSLAFILFLLFWIYSF